MNKRIVAKDLLKIARDLINNSNKFARGQGRIRKEIQNSKSEYLKAIKIPSNVNGIKFNPDGTWQMHHMNPSKKFKLNGNMTLTEFKNMVKQIDKGLSGGDIDKFKEELNTVIFLPKWFHEYVHSNNFNSEKFNDRESLYREMARETKVRAENSKKFQLNGDKINKWLDTLKEIDNTITFKPSDYKEIQELLQKIHEIMLKNLPDTE